MTRDEVDCLLEDCSLDPKMTPAWTDTTHWTKTTRSLCKELLSAWDALEAIAKHQRIISGTTLQTSAERIALEALSKSK